MCFDYSDVWNMSSRPTTQVKLNNVVDNGKWLFRRIFEFYNICCCNSIKFYVIYWHIFFFLICTQELEDVGISTGFALHVLFVNFGILLIPKKREEIYCFMAFPYLLFDTSVCFTKMHNCVTVFINKSNQNILINLDCTEYFHELLYVKHD